MPNTKGAPAPTQPNVADKIDHHLKGERVTTQYIDTTTGQPVSVPMDEQPPRGTVPFLGEVR